MSQRLIQQVLARYGSTMEELGHVVAATVDEEVRAGPRGGQHLSRG
jgi:hypothetical protein